MIVSVKLSSTLRDAVPVYTPEQGLTCELPEGGSVQDVARHMGLPLEDIALVMCNGRQVPWSAVPHNGDTVAYFPAISEG